VAACVAQAEKNLKDRIAKDVSVLYGEDDKKRDSAVADLLAIGKPAIPQLLAVLKDPDHPGFSEALRPAAFVLGELRATEAASDLARLLGTGLEVMLVKFDRTDRSLEELDPSFGPLVKMGDPAVPALRKQLLTAQWPKAFLILRILKAIGTPAAVELGRSYVRDLGSRLRIAKSIFEDEK
jgi:HEAT repeat protein